MVRDVGLLRRVQSRRTVEPFVVEQLVVAQWNEQLVVEQANEQLVVEQANEQLVVGTLEFKEFIRTSRRENTCNVARAVARLARAAVRPRKKARDQQSPYKERPREYEARGSRVRQSAFTN